MSYVRPPFLASMDLDQFMTMWQSLRDGGDELPKAYEQAERIHEAFFGRRRYMDFESAEQQYYKFTRRLLRRN